MIPSDMENPGKVLKHPQEFIGYPFYKQQNVSDTGRGVKQKWITGYSFNGPTSGVADWADFVCYFYYVGDRAIPDGRRIYLLFIMTVEQIRQENELHDQDMQALLSQEEWPLERTHRFSEGQIIGWFDAWL